MERLATGSWSLVSPGLQPPWDRSIPDEGCAQFAFVCKLCMFLDEKLFEVCSRDSDMAGVNLVHDDPLGEDRHWNGIEPEVSEGQGRKRSRIQSHPRPSIPKKPEWDASSSSGSISKSPPIYPNVNPNSRKGSRMGSTTSQPKPGEQIRSSEVIYFTERLKEYYDRSNDDVTSTISSGQKRKYLDQLKDQLNIGEKEQSKAVVPHDQDPTGIKKKLQPLGKDGLMNLIVDMAKKLEEAGKSAEISRLLDAALSAAVVKPAIGRDLTGIDRILKDGFLSFLIRVRQHLPRFPPQVVKFKGLTYGAELRHAKQGFETVGSTLAKCFLACCAERQGMQHFKILDNCSGYLMPGTLTLVCGPPGCGKSSLHKALAGRLHVDKNTTLQGSVKYNHKSIDRIQVRRLAAYIAQTDRHLPLLTVRETCEFANACTSHFTNNPEWYGKSAEKMEALQDEIGGVNLPLELTLHLLGLRGVSDTIVGNAAVRGVSGGERHRVTTAEMVSGTFLVYLLDEISTGLDSSATYDIVSAFRTMARIRRYTCLFSLLQPSPEVFNLFDRIIVMHEGRIIYQGPRDDVLLYFKKLGYVKPNHVDVADFLQEISTEEGVGYLTPGHKHLTVDGFVSAYMASDMYKDIVRILDNKQDAEELWLEAKKPLGLKITDGEITGDVVIQEVESSGTATVVDIQQTSQVKAGDKITAIGINHENLEYLTLPGTQKSDAETIVDKVQRAQDYVRLQLERPLEKVPSETTKIFEKEYVQDWWTSTKVVMRRQGLLLIKSRSFLYARMLQLAVLGIFTGTLFYQVPDSKLRSDMDLRKSLSFIAVMTLSLNTVSQIPIQLDERAVFEKQYAARFFRPYAYVLACCLSQIPLTLIEMVIYTPLIYWLTGLTSSNNGAHYILYILVVFLCAITFAMITRLLASFCSTKEAASGLAGLCIIFFLLFSGFLIVKSKVPDWWIWVYYISPLQWAVTAIVCNEFLSDRYSQSCSDSITYCVGKSDMNIGQAYLDLYSFPTTTLRGYWIPVIILACYYGILTVFCFLSTTYVRHDEVKLPSVARLLRNQPVVSKPSKPPALHYDIFDSSSKPSGNKRRFPLIGFAKKAKAEDNFVISFEPMILSFHQIVYEVDIPGIKDPRVLLSHVSGFSKPKTMTALMGSSGAGKTTLLDVLAGRKTTGRIFGDVFINGFPKEQETFARIAGYVEQNDIHTPFITVRESLEFSGSLRLPRGTSAGSRQKFIEEVMKLLELNEIEDKLVGSIGDGGLSVEEAKRLTIGVELVANPSILFLDEPTSGLDSRAAQIVMRSVTNIVSSGRSVICTIHQPSRRLFLYFSHLMLLKRGGEIAYFGPIGEQAKDLLNYFQSLPGIYECPADQNPASYMLEIIGAGIGHVAQRDFALDYQQSSLAQRNLEELEIFKFGRGHIGKEPVIKGYGASHWVLCKVVIFRQFRTYWRNISYSFGRMMLMVILGLILGSTFYQVDYTNTAGMVSRMGLIYLSVVMVAVSNANNVIPQVNAERVVYYREKASNMYPVLFYSISWTLAEIPYLCISTLIFCSICFTMSGIATGSLRQFFEFWFVFCEYAACITLFGIFLAMMTPNAQVATIIVPIVVNFWNMTSGFMIPKSKIPNFWIWLYWVNPTQYTINTLTSIAFYCDVGTPPCDTCSLLPNSCPDCPCVHVADQGNLLAWLIMKNGMSLDYDARHKNMGILGLFVSAFMVATVVALRFMKYDVR